MCQNAATVLLPITTSNADLFQKLFTITASSKFCHKIIIKDPTMPEMCHYNHNPCEISSILSD